MPKQETDQLVVREYLRVSRDQGGKGKSPSQQHEENVEAITRRGWVLHAAPPYRDSDRSASEYARKEREDFKRLISDLEGGRFDADVLALWESSRGSRRVGEWVDLIDLCRQSGVRIWVTTHNRLYDPENARDRRSMQEDAVDAEYESAKTSERIRRNVRKAAEDGRPHGKAIWGYRRIYDERTRELVEVIPDPETAPLVQEAARRVLDGDSMYSVSRSFNERGIPTRRPITKSHRRALGWTGTAIKQMLSMPTYAGFRTHNGELIPDALWPPLIEPEEWRRLQAVISPPERKRTNDWPAVHLLAGIAVCAECGGPMRVGKQNSGRPKTVPVLDEHGLPVIGDDGKPVMERERVPVLDEDGEPVLNEHGVPVLGGFAPRKHYHTYLCVGTLDGVQGRPGRKGFHVAIKEEFLDEAVTEAVIARLEKPEFLATVGQRGKGVDAERQALVEEIDGYRAYLEQVREQAAEKMRFDLVIDQEARLQPRIEAARKKLAALAVTDPAVVALAESGGVRQAWEAMDLPEKRRVIRAVVSPVVHRMPPGTKGRRGVNLDRIELAWR